MSIERPSAHVSMADLTHEYHDHEHTHDGAVVPMPDELESHGSKLVYLYLSIVDEATVEELQATLEMPQLALFPVLDTLEGANLVNRDGMTYSIPA